LSATVWEYRITHVTVFCHLASVSVSVWKSGKYFDTGILQKVFSKYLELKQKYFKY